MFGNIHLPAILDNHELDDYLSKGWFRMADAIFTCNVLSFDRTFYNAIWLRIKLGNNQNIAQFNKLQKRNAAFRVDIKPAEINEEKENLYTKYKTGISFQTANSLQTLLHDDFGPTPFDTYEICIYDDKKLIAAGFFDLGQKSAAGIVSFYDPEYKKYSLGKYLICLKINYCNEKKLDYFYPGYFAPNYPIFDYKLDFDINNTEYLSIYDNLWHPYSKITNYHLPLDKMSEKLTEAERHLRQNKIPHVRLKYEFYNANNTPHLLGMDLFDYPEFMFVTSKQFVQFNPIIVYDVRYELYRLVKCISFYSSGDNTVTDGFYGSHLLKINEELYSHPSIDAIANFIKPMNEDVVPVLKNIK